MYTPEESSTSAVAVYLKMLPSLRLRGMFLCEEFSLLLLSSFGPGFYVSNFTVSVDAVGKHVLQL